MFLETQGSNVPLVLSYYGLTHWMHNYTGPRNPWLLIGHNERHTVTFKAHVEMCIYVACAIQRFGWMLLNFCMSLLQLCILNSVNVWLGLAQVQLS